MIDETRFVGMEKTTFMYERNKHVMRMSKMLFIAQQGLSNMHNTH